MTDTVLRGTGNSRTLRTVANALTLYPDHVSMIQAMVNGTFPIDVGSLNSAGLTRRGTDLNKANILTDATATGMGLTSSATPNQAFAKLRALIKTAQDSADTALGSISKSAIIEAGIYKGAGGAETEKTLTFGFKWEFLFITPEAASNGHALYHFAIRSMNLIFANNYGSACTSTPNSVTIPGYKGFDNPTKKYAYVAFGTP